MRHVAWGDHERYRKLEAIINKFTMIDINLEVSDLATGLFQLDTHEANVSESEKNVDKRKFDAFHFEARINIAPNDTNPEENA